MTTRVALITGAGSARGIGMAIAQRLGHDGVEIVLADVNQAGAEANAGRLREAGVQAWGAGVDLTSAAQVGELVASVIARYGYLDILVNCAGITHGATLLEMTEADWDRVLTVNLKSMFLTMKAVAPHMVERGSGRIVNISSISAQRGGGIYGGVHYTASKSGVTGLTQAAARELGPHGITCNAVAPGIIETDISASPVLLARRQAFLPTIPAARLGTPADVGAVVAFLASDEASWVTGAVYDVNGGMHIH